MHRFASKSVLRRLRIAALLLVIFSISVILLPLAVVWGTFLGDERGLEASFILLPTAFGSGLLFLFFSAGVRCPLCRGHVLRRLRSSPVSTKARPLLGSYRLRVICGIFFAGNYRCFHCGEFCDTTRPRR